MVGRIDLFLCVDVASICHHCTSSRLDFTHDGIVADNKPAIHEIIKVTPTSVKYFVLTNYLYGHK